MLSSPICWNKADIGFVAFAADHALPFEIFAGFHGQQRRVVLAQLAPVTVHALQPGRGPAAIAFQEADFQPGKTFQDAADNDVDHGHHLAGDMGADMAQQAIAHAEAFEMGIMTGVRAFVKADGHAGFFEFGPERFPVDAEPSLSRQRRGAKKALSRIRVSLAHGGLRAPRGKHHAAAAGRRRTNVWDSPGRNRRANRCRRGKSRRRATGPYRAWS